MNKAATAFFDDKAKSLASISKVLGHPARVTLLKYLQGNDHQTVKSLVEQLPFTQSTVSQHLYMLRSVGLVETKPYKTATIYSISHDRIASYKKALEDVLGKQKDKKQMSLF